jgi:hypothetical protein
MIHSKKKGAEIIAARRVEESNGGERRRIKKLDEKSCPYLEIYRIVMRKR